MLRHQRSQREGHEVIYKIRKKTNRGISHIFTTRARKAIFKSIQESSTPAVSKLLGDITHLILHGGLRIFWWCGRPGSHQASDSLYWLPWASDSHFWFSERNWKSCLKTKSGFWGPFWSLQRSGEWVISQVWSRRSFWGHPMPLEWLLCNPPCMGSQTTSGLQSIVWERLFYYTLHTIIHFMQFHIRITGQRAEATDFLLQQSDARQITHLPAITTITHSSPQEKLNHGVPQRSCIT